MIALVLAACGAPHPPSRASNPDSDGDGLRDAQDRCPLDPEDFDGFQDGDGCPDPDNDRDGIPDTQDRCPNEHAGSMPDPLQRGCPRAAGSDRDGDGVPDDRDKCPDDPEDRDGFQDADGCPDPDNDRDGIPDKDDACPNVPGVPSSNRGQQGCPNAGRR